MDIPLYKLHFSFSKKPLLVGGKAMEYYGLRKSGKDIDLIAAEKDVHDLIQKYPDRVKDLWGDFGVCPFEFEIWKTINYFNYDDLKENAVEQKDFLIISLEKLLFMKALSMDKKKYLEDTKLIVKEILKRQSEEYEKMKYNNEQIVKKVGNITYIQKIGPR